MPKHIERNVPTAALIFALLMLGVGPALAGAGAGVTTMKQACVQSRTGCYACCDNLYAPESKNELQRCRAEICETRYKACTTPPVLKKKN